MWKSRVSGGQAREGGSTELERAPQESRRLPGPEGPHLKMCLKISLTKLMLAQLLYGV